MPDVSCSGNTKVFEDRRFERLAGLSHGHLYRLRQSDTYLRRCNPITKTQPVAVAIGERRKPHPGGQPGFLRVDSVHQGDLNGAKGLYQINIVDAVTQYQFVAAVESISGKRSVLGGSALIVLHFSVIELEDCFESLLTGGDKKTAVGVW